MMIEASFGTFAPFNKLVRSIFAEQMHATAVSTSKTTLFSKGYAPVAPFRPKCDAPRDRPPLGTSIEKPQPAMSSTAAQMESGTAKSGGGAAAPKSKKNLYIGLILVASCIAGGLAGGLSKPIVIGTWKDNWGGYTTVTSTHWYSTHNWGGNIYSNSVYTIRSISNSRAIMQNDPVTVYFPNKWTKHEYHAIADGFAVCTTVWNAETAAATRDTDTSEIYDSSDDMGGCNGWPFSRYTAYAMPIAGKWADNWGGKHEITATEWIKTSSADPPVSVSYPIEAYGGNFILYQNPADDEYNPSKWVLTEFHMIGNDFGYCISVYNGATAMAALQRGGIGPGLQHQTWAYAPSGYNASDATSGCNGFGHSVASPA